VSLESYSPHTRPHLSAVQLIVETRRSDQKYQVLLALIGCHTRRQGRLVEVSPLLGTSPRASLLLLRLAWTTSLASESQDILYDEKD
jgi:hypothetical protein